MSTTTHATHEAASPACLTRLKAGLWRLEVLVQPGARKSEPIGLHDGRARIRLAAPPVEGKANKALVAFVAKRLGLRSRQVTLERGRTSRRKSLLIETETVPIGVRLWISVNNGCNTFQPYEVCHGSIRD